jgi:hypothetical protein
MPKSDQDQDAIFHRLPPLDAGSEVDAPLRFFDESKVKRDGGRFATKEGAGKADDSPKATPKSRALESKLYDQAGASDLQGEAYMPVRDVLEGMDSGDVEQIAESLPAVAEHFPEVAEQIADLYGIEGTPAAEASSDSIASDIEALVSGNLKDPARVKELAGQIETLVAEEKDPTRAGLMKMALLYARMNIR